MRFFATKVVQRRSPEQDATYTLIDLMVRKGDGFVSVCFVHYHFNRRHAWVQIFRASEKEEAFNSFPFGMGTSIACDRPMYKFRGGLPWLHEVAINQVTYRLRAEGGIQGPFYGTFPVTPPVNFVRA